MSKPSILMDDKYSDFHRILRSAPGRASIEDQGFFSRFFLLCIVCILLSIFFLLASFQCSVDKKTLNLFDLFPGTEINHILPQTIPLLSLIFMPLIRNPLNRRYYLIAAIGFPIRTLQSATNAARHSAHSNVATTAVSVAARCVTTAVRKPLTRHSSVPLTKVLRL